MRNAANSCFLLTADAVDGKVTLPVGQFPGLPILVVRERADGTLEADQVRTRKNAKRCTGNGNG
jgi:hypothetical protein